MKNKKIRVVFLLVTLLALPAALAVIRVENEGINTTVGDMTFDAAGGDIIFQDYLTAQGVSTWEVNATSVKTDNITFSTSGVSILSGKADWLVVRDIANTTDKNMRMDIGYFTNLIELVPNGKFILGYYPDTDKYLMYNSTEDKLRYQTDSAAEHFFAGGNVETEGDIYVNGGDIFTASGQLWIQPNSYLRVTTGAGQDINMDFGDLFSFRDRDGSYAVRATVDSATGDIWTQGSVNITDNMNASKNITVGECINFASGGKICSGS